MAGFIPNAWLARLEEATAGKTAISTGTRYLGLATSLPTDRQTATLGSISEVTTAGYARVAVPAFAAATTTAPVRITTPTTFTFAALSADMIVPANYAFLTDAASGTSGLIMYVFELSEPVLGLSGEPITVPGNTLIIE